MRKKKENEIPAAIAVPAVEPVKEPTISDVLVLMDKSIKLLERLEKKLDGIETRFGGGY